MYNGFVELMPCVFPALVSVTKCTYNRKDTYKGCGAIFKPTLSREDAEIAVGIYKLAVRVSIGSGFFGAMFGWIAMLRHDANFYLH